MKKKNDRFDFCLWVFSILIFIPAFTPYSWISYIIVIIGIILLRVYLHYEKRETDKIISEVYDIIKDKKEYFKICPSCGEKLMISEKNCTKCGKVQE